MVCFLDAWGTAVEVQIDAPNKRAVIREASGNELALVPFLTNQIIDHLMNRSSRNRVR